MMIFSYFQGELNRRRGRYDFRTLCCDVFSLLKTQFLRNNNNKGSRSNVNKHELVYGESSSYALEMPDVQFIICVIVYNLYYCCYAKTSSSAVQKRHSKVYGNLIAPSLYSILLGLVGIIHIYITTCKNGTLLCP